MNNLMIFDGREVEVFEFNRQVLFNPKHVAECLGIKNVNDNIRVMNEKQVIKLTNSKIGNPDFRKLHNTGENFLTESGVYKLIFKSRKKEAEKFQDWVTGEVLPSIRQTGGYIPINEEEDETAILAKAVMIAQKTIEKKDELLKAKTREIEEKNKFINQIASSQNTLLVREVAKVISSKEGGIVIGEKKLYQKLRDWELIFKNKNEPQQRYIKQGLFELTEGVRNTSTGTFTYQTMRVTGKGQEYILNRLLREEQINSQWA
ncbi:MAG: phage antirepressor KilAC domain-containing protein [Paraclostridium bifermentans]